MVGSEASKEECRVVTPLRWLCMPVRIEARLGVHTEFVQKQLSTRRPRSAIASMCGVRSEEHTSELQSRGHLVCRLLLEKKKTNRPKNTTATYSADSAR